MGEFVFILPGNGHVTINSGKEELVAVNRVSARLTSVHILRADEGRGVLPDGGRRVGVVPAVPGGSLAEGDPCVEVTELGVSPWEGDL